MPDCTTASAMTWFGTSFDPALAAPQRWTEVPRTLAPLLAAAA
jgi:hypothetical protein